MNLADFVIKLGLDTKKFSSGADKATSDVKRIEGSINQMATKLSAMGSKFRGGMIGAALFGVGRELQQEIDLIIAKANKIKLGAKETGLDTTRFQQVSSTLDQAGVPEQALGNSLETVAAAMDKIRSGQDAGGKLAKDFAELGVSLDDIKKQNHQAVWLEIAANMKTAELTARRLTALGNIMGGKAGDMIPAFAKGFDGAEANRGMLSDEDIAKAERLKELSKGWQGLKTDFILNMVDSWKTSPVALAANKVIGPLVNRFIHGKDVGPEVDKSAEEKRVTDAKIARAKREAEKTEAETIKAQLAPKTAKMQREQIIEGRERLKNETERFAISARDGDALSRMGLFRGSVPTPDPRISEQISLAREHNQKLQRLQESIEGLRRDVTAP